MKVRFLALSFLVPLWLMVAPASAAPATSCASKFVGSWMVRVDATGQTYPSQILPNGRTHVTCPLCTPGGSWTCSGNTITVNVDNGVTTQHTLHADGRTMSGGCCTITRLGAAPPVLSSDSKQPSSKQELRAGLAAPLNPTPPNDTSKGVHTKIDQSKSSRAANTAQPAVPPNQVSSNSASCSDITGTGTGSSPRNCTTSSDVPVGVQTQITQAQSYLQAARTVKRSDPSVNGRTSAALQFRKAAAAFEAAGDVVQAAAAAEEATTLEDPAKAANEKGGQAQPQNPSNAMQQVATNKPSEASSTDLCGTLHSNADQCYRSIIHFGDAGPAGGSGRTPESGQVGSYVDCVKVYCSAMLKAKCAMPIFGKMFGKNGSVGYCVTIATDDPDFVRQASAACPPGKHLFFPQDALEPVCQDNANGSAESQPGPNSTITGIK
jgi:hypothetical protein